MDFKGVLTKKYGGLPGWSWGLVVIGGLVVGLYFYNRSKTTTKTPATTTPVSPTTDASVGTTGYGDYSALGPNAGSTGQGNTTINVGVPATNPNNWLGTLNLTSNGPIPLYATSGNAGDTTLPQKLSDIPSGSTITATGPELVGAWAPTQNGSELWYPVVYNGQAGFVSAYYVANASVQIQNATVPPPPIFPTANTMYARQPGAFPGYDKSHQGVLIVATPDKNGKVVGTLPWGASVVVTGSQTNGFYPVQNGYINQQDLVVQHASV